MDKADRAQDLAVRIYVELIARHTEVTQDSVKMAASAENLATLSIKLADAFLHAEEAVGLAKAPKKASGVAGDELSKWMTK